VHQDVEDAMQLWVSQATLAGIFLTGDILRAKWTKASEEFGVPAESRLKLSNGWLDSFKARNGLKEMKRHGEAGSASETTVEEERKRVRAIIEASRLPLDCIYNMDETGLFYGSVIPCTRGYQRLPPLINDNESN
jgi:hypothetical protein